MFLTALILLLSSCSFSETAEHTVSFDVNGGSYIADQIVKDGETAYKPRNPEREGYVFDAWYYDDQKFNFSKEAITSDIILVAKWFILPDDGIAYLLNDDYTAYYVGDYLGDGKNVVISSAYRGLPVVKIDEWAFAMTEIRTVEIPQSITEIGSNAFALCDSLSEIELPSSIVSIGSGAFQGCTSLRSLRIPKSVEYIGDVILSRCKGLAELSVDSDNQYYDSRNDCNAII